MYIFKCNELFFDLFFHNESNHYISFEYFLFPLSYLSFESTNMWEKNGLFKLSTTSFSFLLFYTIFM